MSLTEPEEGLLNKDNISNWIRDIFEYLTPEYNYFYKYENHYNMYNHKELNMENKAI